MKKTLNTPNEKVNMDEKMKVNQAQTQKVNQTNQGMENFLSTSSSKSPKTEEEKEINGEKMQIKPQIQPPKTNEVKKTTDELIEEIEMLESKLSNIRSFDLTEFNEIVFKKQLEFRLMFVRSKIYVLVRNPENKQAIVSINPPRWGGSSLRYMISQCLSWCRVIERQTNKGAKVLTYKSLSPQLSDKDKIEDDIFD
jgi:hypothetical protein